MKARKMWVTKRSRDVLHGEDLEEGVVAWHEQKHGRRPLPVLVTDATDMPDFEPGDRVRTKASPTDVFGSPVAWHEYEIAHIYFDGERWCFYSTDRTRHPLAKYTKIPREKTVTLRVTGPEDAVDGLTFLVGEYNGVRVERVEDDDER